MEHQIIINNRYELLKLVNTGGQGAVYKALDLETHLEVAVKLLLPSENLDSTQLSRHFLAAARLTSDLNHSGLVKTYDFGTDPVSGPFMVMEYLHGDTLSGLMKKGVSFSSKLILRILSSISEIIYFLHKNDIIHGDIKPENIFIITPNSPDFQVKIFDIMPKRRLGDWKISGITKEYLAPEILSGNAPEPSMDIYACGIIGFELLFRRLPDFDAQGLVFPDFNSDDELHTIISDYLGPPEKRSETFQKVINNLHLFHSDTHCLDPDTKISEFNVEDAVQLMVNQSPFSSLIIDPENRIVFFNEAAKHIFRGITCGSDFGNTELAIRFPEINNQISDTFDTASILKTSIKSKVLVGTVWTAPIVHSGKVPVIHLTIVPPG